MLRISICVTVVSLLLSFNCLLINGFQARKFSIPSVNSFGMNPHFYPTNLRFSDSSEDKSISQPIVIESIESEQVISNEVPVAKKTKVLSPVKSDIEITIATGISGSFVGLVLGGLSDGIFFDGEAPWAPVLLFALFGGGSYYGSTRTDLFVGDLSRNLLGRPLLNTKNNIVFATTKKIESIITDIKNIPNTIKKASTSAIDNLKLKTQQKIADTVAEIKAIPTRTQSSLAALAEKKKLETQQKINEIVSDIKAIPDRIAKAAALKSEELLTDIQKLPNVASKKLTEYTNNKLGTLKSKLPVLSSPMPVTPPLSTSSKPAAPSPVRTTVPPVVTVKAVEIPSIVKKVVEATPAIVTSKAVNPSTTTTSNEGGDNLFSSLKTSFTSATSTSTASPVSSSSSSSSSTATTSSIKSPATVASVPTRITVTAPSKATTTSPSPKVDAVPTGAPVLPPKAATISAPKIAVIPTKASPTFSATSSSKATAVPEVKSSPKSVGIFSSLFKSQDTKTENAPKSVTPTTTTAKPVSTKASSPGVTSTSTKISSPSSASISSSTASSGFSFGSFFGTPASSPNPEDKLPDSKASSTTSATSSKAKPTPAVTATINSKNIPPKPGAILPVTNKSTTTSFWSFGGSKPAAAKPVAATPAKPAVVTTPVKPAVVTTPAKPAVVTTPVKPAVVTAPVKPVAVTPAKPAVVTTPVKPAVVTTPAKPVVVTKSVTPVVAKSTSTSKSAVSSTFSILTPILANKVESLKSNSAQSVNIQLEEFASGTIGAEAFYSKIVKTLGSKEAAFSILPDLIGCLPRGSPKSNLNSFYQTQA